MEASGLGNSLIFQYVHPGGMARWGRQVPLSPGVQLVQVTDTLQTMQIFVLLFVLHEVVLKCPSNHHIEKHKHALDPAGYNEKPQSGHSSSHTLACVQ